MRLVWCYLGAYILGAIVYFGLSFYEVEVGFIDALFDALLKYIPMLSVNTAFAPSIGSAETLQILYLALGIPLVVLTIKNHKGLLSVETPKDPGKLAKGAIAAILVACFIGVFVGVDPKEIGRLENHRFGHLDYFMFQSIIYTWLWACPGMIRAVYREYA